MKNKKEDEFFCKINALSFYRNNKSLAELDKMFPKYKQWVLENKDRDFREVERELMNELISPNPPSR